MTQPKDGYTIKEYAATIGKHHNTVRLMIKTGKLLGKLQEGKTGYQWRVFPDGLPDSKEESLTALELDSIPEGKHNNSTSLITQEEVVELIEYRGQIKVLRDEVAFLRQQVFNHNHWQPWRELIRITGQGLLNIVIRMTTPKSERIR